VTSTFGIWLLGFYLLATSGAHSKDFTVNAVAWYLLVLVIPVAIMAVPAFVHRNYPFSIAFVAILATLLLAGLGYRELYSAITSATANKTALDVSTAANLVKASGWTAWAGAIVLWFIFAREVYTLTGVIGRRDEHGTA